MNSSTSDKYHVRQKWAFDLDGTLIDTQEAVIKAYEQVGVKMPKDAWGKPWQEWLTGPDAEEKHRQKNIYYYKTVGLYAKPMPLLKLVEKFRWPVLTGASFSAVETICIKFAMGLFVPLRGATLSDKIKWLNSHVPGTYVDDMEDVRQAVEERTKWKAISPEECQRLFLLPERIPA